MDFTQFYCIVAVFLTLYTYKGMRKCERPEWVSDVYTVVFSFLWVPFLVTVLILGAVWLAGKNGR